ncbi:MAG TPA: hypothetical protein VKK81_23705, partial [Candidatus Binatia bacterium]|nr:hypothetical protein [Candidatus Binatia bacterium]
YLEQCVGGDGVEVGSHKPQSLQSVLALCYPRPIYAQASSNLGFGGTGREAGLTSLWGEECGGRARMFSMPDRPGTKRGRIGCASRVLVETVSDMPIPP